MNDDRRRADAFGRRNCPLKLHFGRLNQTEPSAHLYLLLPTKKREKEPLSCLESKLGKRSNRILSLDFTLAGRIG